MEDQDTLAFLQGQSARASYITSVCTGSLILGAAGLLNGYRATSHWSSLDLLREFGAIPTAERVVADRNRITAAGVSAGIDFALKVAALLHGDALAQQIQLWIEYDPDPPFSGTPPPAVLAAVRAQLEPRMKVRREAVERAAKQLS